MKKNMESLAKIGEEAFVGGATNKKVKGTKIVFTAIPDSNYRSVESWMVGGEVKLRLQFLMLMMQQKRQIFEILE